ncbi:MAG TPA: right-handed parallel beta-helix repeat-containing protein [Sedimentisphaerales bacterium]|nr:right-handed parallel beta-helix repeat-containing protein [Sedimentisphaerales bacterium]
MYTKMRTICIQTMIWCLLFCGVSQTAYGRSVYAITEHANSTITAYGIQGTAIEYQADVQAHWGSGAVGLALDPDSETLFVTYDGAFKIQLIDAKRMDDIKDISTTDELAGIVFDESEQKLYAAGREGYELYVYLWNPMSKTLTLEDGTYKELEYTDTAYGLAVDEDSQRLFVTDKTNTVKYYDTSDPNFGYLGSIPIVVDSNPRAAVGIAFYEDNGGNKYLYTGAWSHDVTHDYLVQTDITDINDPCSSEKNIGTEAVSMAVDAYTGLVYVTDMNDYGNIKVFNHWTFPSDPCYIRGADISGPADIVLAGDVSYKEPYMTLEKVQDVNGCVMPEDGITYTISYDANGWSDSNVVLTDYLPYEVDFDSASGGGSYDVFTHRVTWTLGELEPNESDSLSLNVTVNDRADMHGVITNRCEIEGDTYSSPFVEVDANVCCWPVDIIYVDEDAVGFNTGMSWLHAYIDLELALNRARTCDANEIWVAEGTYHPTSPEGSSATFALVDGVPLYGGFAGYETLREQRNWLVNETVLTGDTDPDPYGDVSYVVKASDINDGTIDGFVIEKSQAGGAVIYCDGAGVTIEHNRIIRGGYGVKLYSGCWGSVCYNEIRDNSEDGVVYLSADDVLLANNWIHHNYEGGVYIITNIWWGPLLRNNTIADNESYSIYGLWADVNNCIIWGNKSGSFSYWDNYYVTYSCIEGGYEGTGNISNDPCFVRDANDPNNYHLRSDSPCIDTGNNEVVTDPNETDIDGEKRIIDGDSNGTAIVDMGADEYYWSRADFDLDGVVNFIDYAIFAEAWQCSAGEANYNPLCNLAEDNNSIDCNDLRVFCEDWLWYASWTLEVPGCRDGGSAGGKSMAAESAAETLESEAYQPDVEELLNWLEELWLSYDELGKTVPEDEWLKFIEAVKSAVE